MSNLGFWDVLRWLFWAVCLYEVGNLVWALSQQLKLKRQLAEMPGLSSQTKKNDYLKLEGEIRFPISQTPFLKQACSYWQASVQAEFQTKRKKPSSGMQTHQPVIYRQSNGDMPVLMASEGYQIQLVFDDFGRVLRQPERKTKTLTTPTYPEIQAVAKSKYEKYIIVETYLPVNAKVTCLGHVLEIDKNRVILGSLKQTKQPPQVYLGQSAQMQEQIAGKIKMAWGLLLFCCGFGGLSFWFYQTYAGGEYSNLILNLASLCFILLVGKLSQKVKR